MAATGQVQKTLGKLVAKRTATTATPVTSPPSAEPPCLRTAQGAAPSKTAPPNDPNTTSRCGNCTNEISGTVCQTNDEAPSWSSSTTAKQSPNAPTINNSGDDPAAPLASCI